MLIECLWKGLGELPIDSDGLLNCGERVLKLQLPGRANLRRSAVRLVVSADAIANEALPTVFALHVLSTDPGGLLAVRIGEHGWAFAMELDLPLRSRLTEKIGEASAEEMDSVSQALRALFEL